MNKEIPPGTDGSIERSFGQVLRRLRHEHNLSQESLGFRSGYHRTYISQLERGEKSPSLRTFFRLSKALDVEASEMIKLVQFLLPTENSGSKAGDSA